MILLELLAIILFLAIILSVGLFWLGLLFGIFLWLAKVFICLLIIAFILKLLF